MQIRSVLFVGRRNAARSIMAESCFNAAAIPGWRAFSAGWQPEAKADARALRLLEQGGFPADGLLPKPVAIFRQPGAPQIDLSVFLDAELPSDVAAYPGLREFWRVPDPSGGADPNPAYREALDAIATRIGELILSGRLFAELRAAS
ncbi:MAG: hypothetical protein BroJett030_04050 [Alphaproteobacteria bacterium]|nr:MAG: hypothetical protein BroJett030_04050 [Alphaproteobacteria bacterium]